MLKYRRSGCGGENSLRGMGCVSAASKGWVTKGWTGQNIDKLTGQNTEMIIVELSHTCRALGLLTDG